jgi:hypothetical protein
VRKVNDDVGGIWAVKLCGREGDRDRRQNSGQKRNSSSKLTLQPLICASGSVPTTEVPVLHPWLTTVLHRPHLWLRESVESVVMSN